MENLKAVTDFPDFVKTLPEVDVPFDGVQGWLMNGDTQQVVYMEFAKTIEVPEHTHKEQWEFAIDGEVELHKEGETTLYTTGESFFIPTGIPHSATVHAGYKAMIVFNSPDRYVAKM